MTAILTTLILISTACCVLAQTPTTTAPKELVQAQVDREKAQAAYYRGELEVSRRQMEAALPKTYKTMLEKYTAKDPGDLVESLAAVLGVFLIFLILYNNYRFTRLDQRDARFFEALKRFGDMESPALRSTAAGLLAQMGRQRAYADTALDQLLSGLMLEEHPVVQASIRNAVVGLAKHDPELVSLRLRHARADLQQKVKSTLGDAMSLKG